MTLCETMTRRIDLFREEAEQWESRLNEVSGCLTLESSLEFGLSLYRMICHDEERWTLAVRTGRQPFCERDEQEFLSLFRAWLKPAADMLNAIEDCESQGFIVDGAAEFRQSVCEIQGILTADDQFFAGEALTSLRDLAIKDLQDGRCSRLEP